MKLNRMFPRPRRKPLSQDDIAARLKKEDDIRVDTIGRLEKRAEKIIGALREEMEELRQRVTAIEEVLSADSKPK